MQGVTFLGDEPDQQEDEIDSEYIDEPFFVTEVNDSMHSPFDALEKIILSDAPNEDKFRAFQTMYSSPYLDKNERCTKMLLTILPDERMTIEERFSWLTRLKLSSDSMHVCLYGYVFWFYTYDEPILYKILSAQFLLSHPLQEYPFMKTHMKFSQQWLYQLAKRESEDIQIRSEAADILARLGTFNFRKVANEIIQTLGHSYIEKRKRTIYSNSQNVHDIHNIYPVIDLLVFHTSPLTVTLDDIAQWLHSFPEAESSFQRIILDTALYHGYPMSDLLRHVTQRIRGAESRDELELRLIEELIEMKGWCSTGHLVRLLNTLQGFDSVLTLELSVKDELKSALFTRMNKQIKMMSADLQEELIQAFTSDEKSLLEEFVETYSVYDELLEEYKMVSREVFDGFYKEALHIFMGK